MDDLKLRGDAASQTPRIAIYEINDYDWVVAHSAEEALRYYMDTTGLMREESLPAGEEPIEISEAHLDALTLWDEDTDKTMTFRQGLAEIREKGGTVPAIFASSEI